MGSKARVNTPAGGSGNVIRDSALGLVPELVEPLITLNAAVWDAGVLSPAEVELARLENAQHTGCTLCQAVRYDIAVADGLNEDKVSALREDSGAAEAGLSARERLIRDFVRQFHRDPGQPPAALLAAMRDEFSEAERLHLAMLVSYFAASSRGAVALGGMPAEVPRMEISVPR